MSATQWKLDNLIALVDFNNQQADGPSRDALANGAEAPKWAAFGWYAQEVDGNDLAALVQAFDNAKSHTESVPRVIICNTKMCKGVPFLEARESTHFIRVEADEWAKALAHLDEVKPNA